jgi:hypothetical protein
MQPALLPDLVYRHHVRVPDPRQRLSFAPQAIYGLSVIRRPQNLHGDVALESPLACQPDLTHPSGTQPPK